MAAALARRNGVAWTWRRLCSALGAEVQPRTLLVCAHANGFCKEMWQPIWDRLSLRQDLGEVIALALDLPGHGSSAKFDTPLNLEVFGSAVLSAMDDFRATKGSEELKFDFVVGLGHSIGSTSLLYAEDLRPAAFSSLCLIEPILIKPRPSPMRTNPLAEATLKRRCTFASRQEAFDNYTGKGAYKHWQPEQLRLFVDSALVANADGRVQLKCDPEQEAEVYVAPTPIIERVSSIMCPVTVLNASPSNGHVPAERALENFRNFGNPRALEILPNCTHFMPMEIPDIVANRVAGHLLDTIHMRVARL